MNDVRRFAAMLTALPHLLESRARRDAEAIAILDGPGLPWVLGRLAAGGKPGTPRTMPPKVWTRRDELRHSLRGCGACGAWPDCRLGRLLTRLNANGGEHVRTLAIDAERELRGHGMPVDTLLQARRELSALLETASLIATDDLPINALRRHDAALAELAVRLLELADVATPKGTPSTPTKRRKPNPLAEKSIEEIERETPPLDSKSVEWIRAEQKNSEKLGLPLETLKVYRSESMGGRVSPNKMFGIDRYGRIWRRAGTPKSRVWYYVPSLPKSVK